MDDPKFCYNMLQYNINDLVQDCSNSSMLAVELLQFCTMPGALDMIFNVLPQWQRQNLYQPVHQQTTPNFLHWWTIKLL